MLFGIGWLGWLVGGRRGEAALSALQRCRRPLRIVVVRLDGRLGPLLMTTPLLTELRRRFPRATIDVVVHPMAARVLWRHPAHVDLVEVGSWWPLGKGGLLPILRRLRGRRYDVCLDAGSPSEPNVAQAALVLAIGARLRIGYGVPAQGRLYHLRVAVPRHHADSWHEIARRLALLTPIDSLALRPAWPPRDQAALRSSETLWPLPTVGPLELRARPPMRAMVEQLHRQPFVVINLGARAAALRVSPADGATVANICKSLGLTPVLVAGTGEGALCRAVCALSTGIVVAPDADLADLALLFSRAVATVSGDTGPTHLAVALATPTLAIFSKSPWTRFGYAMGQHASIDARTFVTPQWAPQVRHFLATLAPVARAGRAIEAPTTAEPESMSSAHLVRPARSRPASARRASLADQASHR